MRGRARGRSAARRMFPARRGAASCAGQGGERRRASPDVPWLHPTFAGSADRPLQWPVTVAAQGAAVSSRRPSGPGGGARPPRPRRHDTHAGAHSPPARGPDRHSGRPHAQPQGHRPDAPAGTAGHRHRGERFGEVVARLRHGLRRGAAAVRGIAVRLRPAVPRADGEAGRGSHRRHLSGHRDPPEEQRAEPALDGRDDDRDLRLPAAAVRPRRPDDLSRLRRGGDARDPGGGGRPAGRPAGRDAAAGRLRPGSGRGGGRSGRQRRAGARRTR